MTKKMSLSQAQVAASGALPQQQDIMGDVKKSRKVAKQSKTEIEATNLVSDPAEAAANSEDFQGEEVKDAAPVEVEKPRASGSVLPAQTVKGAAKAVRAEKAAKVAKPKAAKVVSTTTKDGHPRLTAAIAVAVLADLAAGVKRADIAIKYDLGTGTVSDIAAGSPYIRKMMEKAGLSHPKGAYVPYIRPSKK